MHFDRIHVTPLSTLCFRPSRTPSSNQLTVSVDQNESVMRTVGRFYLMSRRSGVPRWQSMRATRCFFRTVQSKGYVSLPLPME